MISVIICAAGRGKRAGFAENKVLHELGGLPVLSWSLSAFSAAGADEIVVACNERDEARVKALLAPFPAARTMRGGETRGASVYNALKEVRGDIVLVHDAARPFVSQAVIQGCIQSVKDYGSGVSAIPASDTVALAADGNIFSVPARETAYLVQTPQGFERDELLSAYEKARAEGLSFTDESGVYAQYIAPPHLCAGERENRKLTYAEDFLPAERVGFGVDTHAFGAEADHIVLGGVHIPFESGLIAHSDGDVVCHALMDALLSAAGLDDIGHHFPDTDERFLHADSMELLRKVVVMLAGAGYAAKNASISVLAERPRLAPHIAQMKENLAGTLGVAKSAVGIAAGTNERLGYVGEGKGITVYATVLLMPVKAQV